MVEFGVFGAPRFSVQRFPNPLKQAFFDTEYDRAKGPPYNGHDPPPAPGSLKALLFPPLLSKVQNKGMQGVQNLRYDAELPPIISIVRHPGRPVILGIEFWELWTENRGAPKTPNSTTADPIGTDFREGDEDSNFSVFRVRRFTESPEPLH